MYEYVPLGDEPFQGGDVRSLQRAILENGCQLRLGVDGAFGPDTAQGVRCLVAARSRGFVLQSWPWVADRMELPPESDQEPEVAGWFEWAAAGVALVSVITVGSLLTRGKR